jgi:hypothetical protein
MDLGQIAQRYGEELFPMGNSVCSRHAHTRPALQERDGQRPSPAAVCVCLAVLR